MFKFIGHSGNHQDRPHKAARHWKLSIRECENLEYLRNFMKGQGVGLHTL